jgi:hypothetical protein
MGGERHPTPQVSLSSTTPRDRVGAWQVASGQTMTETTSSINADRLEDER